MAEEKEKPAKVKGDEFKTPKGNEPKNMLLTLVVLINTILMGAIAYFQFTTFTKKSNEPTVKELVEAEMSKVHKAEDQKSETGEAKEEDGKNFPLEGFTANLAQGDGPRRFVRLNVVLKFSKDSVDDEFKSRKPQIRDRIISILNSKRPEDLLQGEGKVYLKEEIKSAINSFLVDGRVIDVFYTGFQIN